MKKLVILLTALSFAACQSDKKSSSATDSIQLHNSNSAQPNYTYDTLQVASKHIISGKSGVKDTTTAILVYPKFKDAATNSFIENKILSASVNVPDQPKPKSYDEILNNFIKTFDTFSKDNQPFSEGWMLNDRTEVITEKPNYLSLLHFTESYAGGAHPNSMALYFNYNPETHQEILLDSLIEKGSMPKLVAIAEKIFRKNEKLTPTQSLKDIYFFEHDRFALNGNFTITNEGLKFLYNPYEIKAYAAGTTELLIPFSELAAVARPNNLLSTPK